MPGVAFPPVGPLGLGSPPSPVLCAAKTTSLPVSGRFACRSLPDTWPASVRSCCPRGARAVLEAFTPRQDLWSPGVPIREYGKETGGSPKFPSFPFACMPRSQTPVVSSALALTRPRLLPSGACKPSAFPSIPLERYPAVHDSTYFGAPSRGLHPRSIQLRTPIAGCAHGYHS